MVLRIAICDDQLGCCANTAQAISPITGFENAEIRQFFDFEELLESLRSRLYAADIAILNLQAAEMGELARARQINMLAPSCQIIFLNVHLEDTFCAYVLITDCLASALDKAMEKRGVPPQMIMIQKRATTYSIAAGDIEYVERVLRKTRIMAHGEEYWTKRTPEELLGQIEGSSFLRCHQSFYVNMKHVVSLNTDGFALKNGLSVPVSRAYKKVAKERFCSENISRRYS